MAEIRQLARRVGDLEEAVRASPSSPAVLSSLASAETVSVLEKRVADLESSLVSYKGFLDEALQKLGLLEQKVVGLETKVCQCSSDCGGDSVVQIPEAGSPEPEPTQMTVAENPVFVETLEDDSENEDEEDA
jgi:hypothetical protein